MKNKFDEAAYSADNKITFEKVSLEILNDLRKTDNQAYIKTYYGNLYCPECFKPQIDLVISNKTGDYFLRGFHGQPHSDICHKGFDTVKSSAFNSYIESSESYELINYRLKKIIEKLFKNISLKNNPFLIKVINNKCTNEELSEIELRERNKVYQVPNKSITAPFEDNDYNAFKLFYGNVDIILFERKNSLTNKIFYSLNIYNRSGKYICNLTMKDSVASYMQKIYNIKSEEKTENMYIAFAAILQENNGYKSGRLIHSDLFVIDKV